MLERYTVYEFIQLLEYSFTSHPNVNNFYKHKFKAEATDNIEYPAIVVTIDNLSVGINISTFLLNIMYVDRNTPERDNTDYINSIGVSIITEVMNKIRNEFQVSINENLVFRFFTQQFSNDCAGVYCQTNITLPSDIGQCAFYEILKTCC